MSQYHPRPYRTTARSGLPLRVRPQRSGKVLARIPAGETVTALGPARHGWIRARYDSPAGPRTGYCSFRYLTDLSDPYLFPEENADGKS